MPAIQLAYTDAETGATYPNALVVITNWRLQGDPPAAEVDLFYYVDQPALIAQLPFRKRHAVPLTAAEVARWIQQFAQAGYQTLMSRSEFAGSVFVP